VRGVNLYLADGAGAGQEVFHAHLHVLPRFAGDGFALAAQFQHPDRAELDTIAALIRGHVQF
jgi:histidine triad (HIT) family protein